MSDMCSVNGLPTCNNEVAVCWAFVVLGWVTVLLFFTITVTITIIIRAWLMCRCVLVSGAVV